MKKIYRDILKELEKGNIVLIDVRGKHYMCEDRFRMAYGKRCEFDFAYGRTGCFSSSCFMFIYNENYGNYNKVTSSKQLIELMEKYDNENDLKVKKFMVLK